MKKSISILLGMLGVGIYFWLEWYTQYSFDYHVADFISYMLVWDMVFFIISIVANFLDNKSYKTWFGITSGFILVSLLLAYSVGEGNGAIVSLDGEIVTWVLAGAYLMISIVTLLTIIIRKKHNSSS